MHEDRTYRAPYCCRDRQTVFDLEGPYLPLILYQHDRGLERRYDYSQRSLSYRLLPRAQIPGVTRAMTCRHCTSTDPTQLIGYKAHLLWLLSVANVCKLYYCIDLAN